MLQFVVSSIFTIMDHFKDKRISLKLNMREKLRKLVKQEYYLLPWQMFWKSLVILGFANMEQIFVAFVLKFVDEWLYSAYKYGMALASVAMLCGVTLANYQKDFALIDQHSKGRLDNFIMRVIWFILFIIFAIPWSISRMCYMSLTDIAYISGWFVGSMLIIAAVLDAVLLVLCRHFYYRK